MKKQTLAVMVSAVLGVAALVWAHDMPKPITGSPELQQLKQLAGKWQGTSTPMDQNAKPGPVATEFRVTAAGSAVEESLMRGTPGEMVDMYADEGGKLAMTHYCAMGNQPHMVMKSGSAHQINLEMAPTPGIDPNSSHMHMLTLEFPDADHLTERWTNFNKGKPGEIVVLNFTRVK